jgi:hypothetical protein
MATFYDAYGRPMNTDEVRAAISVLPEYDEITKKYRGEIVDTVTFLESGSHELMPGYLVNATAGEMIELPVKHNLVVDACSKLIAALIKGDATYASDANYKLYWEVGSGNGSWNDASPPNPVAGDTTLLAPLERKQIQAADMKYIDGSNNTSASVTNRLEITVKFLSAEANGSLREFGIFAGNATTTLGSGFMINRKTHGIIFKTTGIELQRTLRLTL